MVYMQKCLVHNPNTMRNIRKVLNLPMGINVKKCDSQDVYTVINRKRKEFNY